MKHKQELSTNLRRYLKKTRQRKLLILSGQIGFLILFLALWQILTDCGVLDSFITSSPSKICLQLKNLSITGELFRHVWVSTKETLIGFVLGTLIGTVTAIILWWSPLLNKIFEPYLVVLNSLPKVALGPIIIIWAGTGQTAIVTMAVLISVVITTITMLNGFNETDENKILLLKTMNATKFQIFTKLVFPSNLPTLLSALKINVGMAWIGTIMGEYLTSKAGLGYLILYGGQVFKLDLVMTCILVLCVVAAVMYLIVARIEKMLIKWRN